MSRQERDRFEKGLDMGLVATGKDPVSSEKQPRFREGTPVIWKGEEYSVARDNSSYPDADDHVLLRPLNVPEGDEFLTAPRSEISPVG